jgi:hypothetical protein
MFVQFQVHNNQIFTATLAKILPIFFYKYVPQVLYPVFTGTQQVTLSNCSELNSEAMANSTGSQLNKGLPQLTDISIIVIF